MHWKFPIIGPIHPGPSGHAGEAHTYFEHVAPYVEQGLVESVATVPVHATYGPVQGVTEIMVHLYATHAAFALEHEAFVPPLAPAHVQVDDPPHDPATLEVDVPTEHAYWTALLHTPFTGQAWVLQDWLVAPTVPQTESELWVQDCEVPGFAVRQAASASTEPSYLRHWTVRDWVPFPFPVQEDVRL